MHVKLPSNESHTAVAPVWCPLQKGCDTGHENLQMKYATHVGFVLRMTLEPILHVKKKYGNWFTPHV